MFYDTFVNTVIIAVGMVAIALPPGAALAVLLTRTDVKYRALLEVLVLVPMFIPSIVLAFGYTVSVGPSWFLSILARSVIGFVPWNLYTLAGILVVTGLSHVPHVYCLILPRRLSSGLS